MKIQKIDHRYYLGKKEIPGVNEIIDRSQKYLPDYSPELAEFGTNVHAAISSVIMKPKKLSLFMDDKFAVYKLRIDQAIAFLKEFDEVLSPVTEKIVYDRDLKYAGTADLVFQCRGKTILVDWKTGQRKDRDLVQVCAYALTFGLCKPYVVYLSPDRFEAIEPNSGHYSTWRDYVGYYRVAKEKGEIA